MLGGVRAVRTWLAHAEGKELKALEEQVDAVWKKRLTAGDPVEAYLQRDKVRKLVPSCIEKTLQKNAYMGFCLERRTSPHMTKRQDALGGCRAEESCHSGFKARQRCPGTCSRKDPAL